MSTYTYTATLTVQECISCLIIFGVPPEWDKARERDHRSFFCPNGHKQWYTGKSDLEKERQRTAEAEALAASRLAQVDQERAARRAEQERHEHTQRRLRSTKAVVTKTKKRIAAGKCPCCHERFGDLADHIASNHPGYSPAEAMP